MQSADEERVVKALEEIVKELKKINIREEKKLFPHQPSWSIKREKRLPNEPLRSEDMKG